ncbi:hypothetical protein P879_05614 [Paragonimus westermani]|uniref:Uncharacterized protein n=1 Tax=Paragonimus westermani TaxID=34504 RepID=A0A8T0D2W7_9TREM|nr:hypothetical protein P879_05614 [Paragonimus westermani]
MECLKHPSGKTKVLEEGSGMTINFNILTLQALFGPAANVLTNTWSNVTIDALKFIIAGVRKRYLLSDGIAHSDSH